MSELKNSQESRSFHGAAARRSDLLDCLTKDRTLMEQDVSHCSVISVDEGEWADAADFSWDAFGIAVALKPERRLVIVGEDGQYYTYLDPEIPEGQIEPKPRLIRRARTIDGFVYVCGVGRQVYKRLDVYEWSNESAPAPKKISDPICFEDIAGYSENEIYCCGWKGELWHYDGSDWHDYSELTNITLTSLACVSDGYVYVVGQQGVLLKGRRDTWEVIQLDNDFETDMWDVHEFEEKIYISTMTGLYILNGQQLEEVEFDDMLNGTFYRLTSAEGTLWSVGDSDVLSFDGTEWTRYT